MEKQLKFQSVLECMCNGEPVKYLSNPLYISLLGNPRFKNIRFNAPTKPIPSYTCAPKQKCKCCLNFCLNRNCNLNFSSCQNLIAMKCGCTKYHEKLNCSSNKIKINCGCH